MTTKRKQMVAMTRSASITPSSYNEQERTVDVVFATDTPVPMYDWELGDFLEILSMDSAHIRWQRMQSGAPVLDNHRRRDRHDQLGVVLRAWLENGQCCATIQFSEREEVQDLVKDVAKGIVRNVSVGYRVFTYQEEIAKQVQVSPSGQNTDKTPTTLRAIDWEPYEISFVPVGADVNAGVRNDGDTPHEVKLILSSQTEERTMPDNSNPIAETPPAATLTPEQLRAEQERGQQAERKRVADIRTLWRKAGMPDADLDTHIENGTTVEAFRTIAFEFMASKNPTAGNTPNPTPETRTIGLDERDKVRNAIETALALRSGKLPQSEIDKLDKDLVAASRKYRSMSLLELGRDALLRGGATANDVAYLDKMQLAGRAITSNTSDLPIILEGTNRRILMANYVATPDTWQRFCAIGSVEDFREYKRLRMGSFGNLDSLNENQEYKTKPITDADYEKVSIGTKGNMINLSRQMIINDDLQAFTRLAQMLGRAAKRSIEADVYAFLLSNSGNGGNLVDGNPIFHSSHNNIATAGALSIAQLDAARVKMRQQMDKDSNDYLDVNPEILLINVAQGGQARIYNNSQYDTDVSNKSSFTPNKVAGLFTDIVDTPRIPTDDAFYMFANPSIEPVIEVAFLQGEQMPFMEMQNGWTQDGVEWKIRLDYGVNGVGFRGAVKVPKV